MTKTRDAPALELFKSFAAITDALNVLEKQCTSAGFGSVADRLRDAKASIAAAADIVQAHAYDALESVGGAGDGGATKH